MSKHRPAESTNWSQRTVTVSNKTDRATRRAAVYRLYAPDGTLLYIGSSYNPDKRCEVHRRAPWWREVGRRTEEWFPNRSQAYTAETKAIWREKPRHNVACTAEGNARRAVRAQAQAPLYRRRARAASLADKARAAARPSFLSLWDPREPVQPVLDMLDALDKAYARAQADPSWVPARYVSRAEVAVPEMVARLQGLGWFGRSGMYARVQSKLAKELRSEGADYEEVVVVMAVATARVNELVDMLAED